VYNIPSTASNEQRLCKDQHGEKITMMQQHSTVDSRLCLTIFKMLVSQTVWAVWLLLNV